ncbi:MAG: hypothetical protein ACREL9_13080 [Gemmatimonadales bacterium]
MRQRAARLRLGAALLCGWGGCAAVRCASAQVAPPATPASAPSQILARPVASLVIPGSGQLLAGQDRGAVYLATELYALLRYVQLERAGEREADRFRALAYVIARRGFTAERRDTVFEYYEQMQRFPESGAFDGDSGVAFAPESDPTTYNGSVWLLARRTFWPDPDRPPDPTSPEYQRALQFYQERAVGPDYRWSWRDAPLEHQEFREAIRRSDRALRRAQTQIGILLANHVASAVDALISSRLAAAAGRPAYLRTVFGAGGRAVLEVRIPF